MSADAPSILSIAIGIAPASAIAAFTAIAAVCSLELDGDRTELPPELSTHSTLGSFSLKATVSFLQAVEDGIGTAGVAAAIVSINNAYVADGYNKWMRNWKTNGWKTKAGSGVKMRAEWEELDRLGKVLGAQFAYVPALGSSPDESERNMAEVVEMAQGAIPGFIPSSITKPPIARESWTSSKGDFDDFVEQLARTARQTKRVVEPLPPPPMLSGQGMW